MSLRLMIASDSPAATSGYSIQVRHATRIWRDLGHTVAICATFGHHGSITEWDGFPMYPGGLDGFGNDAIGPAARDFKADLVVTLKDLWVYRPQEWGPGVRWCVPEHTLITLANGHRMPIGEVVDRRLKVKVKAWDGQKTVAADILDYQRIPAQYAGEIVEIETESGESLHVTAENQVLVLRNGVIDWIDAGCVVPGDVVYCNSSRTYETGGNNGTTQGIVGEGGGSDSRTRSATNNSGMGVYSRDSGWRGDNLHQSSAQAGALGAAAYSVGLQYKPSIDSMAWREDRYEDRWAQSPSGDKKRAHDINGVRSDGAGLSLLSHPESDRAAPYYQTAACADCDGVDREPGRTAVQQSLYRGGAGFVAPSAGFEPKSVACVSRRGRPYSFVYDITTTAGCFVAGDILIHNCPLVPIDHDPLPQGIAQILRSAPAYATIAYSAHGRASLLDAGFAPYYAPHAYDPGVMFPEDRTAARAALGIPDDVFLVGMVAVNRGGIPSRKAWPQNLEGFAHFARTHPEARLLLHTYTGQEGHEQAVNLPALADQLGITDRVAFVDQAAYKHGLPDAHMRRFYSALDVLNAVSLGEGFGVPTLEAQSCGTPVLVGDWCAQRDLCFAGAAIPPEDALRFYDGQGAYVYVPHPQSIGNALRVLYDEIAAKRDGMRQKAIDGARRYEYSRVREDWRAVLGALEDRLRSEVTRGVVRIVHPASVICEASDSWAADVGAVPITADAGKKPTVPPVYTPDDMYAFWRRSKARNPKSTLKDVCERFDMNYDSVRASLSRARRQKVEAAE